MNAVVRCCRFQNYDVWLSFLDESRRISDTSKQLSEFEQYKKDHPLRVISSSGVPSIFKLNVNNINKFRKEALSNTPKRLFNIYRSGIVLNTLDIKLPILQNYIDGDYNG